MMEGRLSPPRADDRHDRAVDAILRTVARIVDVVAREQDQREHVRRRAACPKAACRRSGLCSGVWCGSSCGP